ncbi:MAG TPA: radical SAM family heme chaperone HemW [Acidimicrobiia bacterium]|nr:radical SAM family heme chaperone HemW [Acidimicrobiia bacterium]
MPTEPVRPDAPELADAAAGWVGAYVHVPFCHRVCPYCDFAVVEGRDDLRGQYFDALVAEIAASEPFQRPLDAVFVGGGTPTSVPPESLAAVVTALADRFGLAVDAEVSIEANPEDLDSPTAAGLACGGFNRVSLGVQSFDPLVLEALGRRHTPVDADLAIGAASEWFPSVNVDLIFGTVGETAASWRSSVERALAAGIQHLSVYALTVERGTPLARAIREGATAPDPDDQADKYLVASRLAAEAGMVRYETSNYAAAGHACKYNLLTWALGEYAAFGNGAHRHRGGVRSWNVRRVDRYVERAPGAVSGEERLDEWRREVERVFVGLRRAAGVFPGEAGTALVASAAGQRLIDAGVLASAPHRVTIERPLLGDEVSRALLALDPPAPS